MKQKKLKFTFIGLAIYLYFATAFIVNKMFDPVLWVEVFGGISLLIGLYTHYNSKDKKNILDSKGANNELDKDYK